MKKGKMIPYYKAADHILASADKSTFYSAGLRVVPVIILSLLCISVLPQLYLNATHIHILYSSAGFVTGIIAILAILFIAEHGVKVEQFWDDE